MGHRGQPAARQGGDEEAYKGEAEGRGEYPPRPARVLGTANSDKITLRLKPGNKSRLQVDVGGNGSAEFTFKRSAFNRIVVHGASGADMLSINERYGVFTDSEATSLLGDTGNDVLHGGSAAERLFGGIGNDTIDGKRGNDLIEGGTGGDLVVFNGSKAAEKFAFSVSGKRLRFAGAATMNIAGVERFDLRGPAARTTSSSTTSRAPGSPSSTSTWRTTGLQTSSTSRARRLQTSSGFAATSRSAASGRRSTCSVRRPRTTS